MKALSLIILLLSVLTACEERIESATITINTPGPGPKQSKIELNPNSKIYVYKHSFEYMGKEVTLEEIEVLFQKLDKEKNINIYVSNKAEHYSLVNLLNIMRKLDLSHFSLHTLKENIESTEPEDREEFKKP